MCFEHVGEAEALATHLAGIGLLPSVGAAVALHVGPAGEALPTNLTNERLLSCTELENKRLMCEKDRDPVNQKNRKSKCQSWIRCCQM